MTWLSKEQRGGSRRAHFIVDGLPSCAKTKIGGDRYPRLTAPLVPRRASDHLCGLCARMHPGTTCECGACAAERKVA